MFSFGFGALLCLSMLQDDEGLSKDAKRKISRGIKEGDYFFTELQFSNALEEYQKVYKLDTNNLELNFKIAQCYLYSDSKYKCLSYFQKVYKNDSTYEPMIHFYLGRAYQLNYKFEKAVSEYTIHKQRENKIPKKEFISLDKRIVECKNGIRFMNLESNISVENLGGNVNSEYPEYRPLITSDGSFILFTAMRAKSAGSMLDPFNNQYYEDIYISRYENNNWQRSEVMDDPINTMMNDAISGMSYDGKTLVLYNDHQTQGDLYISEYKEGVWSVPERLPSSINSRYIESTSAFSPDKKALYFVSERTDLSLGLKDIYVSYKTENGGWSEPKNLGPTINTNLNEEAISMHPNGKMLFFSSEGHSSMGGYDIFVSKLQDDGSWGKAINLGIPINTPDDDLFFTMSGNNNIAYYSTVREGGLGNEDIYKVVFNPNELFAEKPATSETIEEPLITKDIDSVGVFEEHVNVLIDTLDSTETIDGPKEIVAVIPAGLDSVLREKSLEEIYTGLQDEEIVDMVFETEVLDQDFETQKLVLDKAKIVTNELLKKNTIDIEVIKKNPTKVIVEIINTSSSKGMEFMYPSGGKGTFVIMLPQPEYEVALDIEDVSVAIGKSVLVSSEVQKELISNNIIAVEVE